jgi:HEPN domain-containing protein
MLAQPLDDSRDVLADVADELFWWLIHTHVQPEANRRADAGTMERGEPIYRAQVLFYVDRKTVVRLNEEVGGSMRARATRPIAKGETVTVADVYDLSDYQLPEADRDAAHFTLLLHSKGWSLAFDGRYNRVRADEHVGAADEFVESARRALDSGALRAFVDNAYSAAELLAKAELLPLPDPTLLTGRHGTIGSNYNLWARIGNTEQRFADLLNRLGELRGPGRYLRKALSLDASAARQMLATLDEMRVHAGAVVSDSSPRAGFSVYAHRVIRRGEVVEMPPGGLVQMLRPPKGADQEGT